MSILKMVEKKAVRGAKNAVNATMGGVLGVGGSIGGALGDNPQRDSVPAYQYGKQNKAFGKAYNAASTPGKLMAQGEQAVGKAVKSASRLPLRTDFKAKKK